ncbi:MAG: biotin transporter BioY [candidate division WOR-3 bacterium]
MRVIVGVRNKVWIWIAFWNITLILSSGISIPLPFSPVPITLQTLILILTILSLGKMAYIPVLAYITEGALGLPVFAGWTGGIWKLLGPTGGYILGFLVSSLIVGYMWEILGKREKFIIPLGFLVHLIIYFFGVIQLSIFTGWNNVLALGVLPFLYGDTLKVITSYLIFKGWKAYT